MPERPSYAIKAEIADPHAGSWAFAAQKTMYDGKRIAAGDVIYLFASENEGGAGLVARGVVTTAMKQETFPPSPRWPTSCRSRPFCAARPT